MNPWASMSPLPPPIPLATGWLQPPGRRGYAMRMSDPFVLITGNDLDGLRAELAHDPDLAHARHPSGASLVAWAAYMGNVGAISAVRAHVTELDPHEAIGRERGELGKLRGEAGLRRARGSVEIDAEIAKFIL